MFVNKASSSCKRERNLKQTNSSFWVVALAAMPVHHARSAPARLLPGTVRPACAHAGVSVCRALGGVPPTCLVVRAR